MKAPWLTLALCAIGAAAHLLPQATQGLLVFDTAELARGNPLGLVTGHWIHADGEHLLWNAGALLVLGGMIEQHSRRLLLGGLAAGTIAVDALLLAPWVELQRYCGLSGVLNTLLVILLVGLWQRQRSPLLPLVGVLSLAKIALEMSSGNALFSHTAWPPFAAAHLAGVLGAGLVLLYRVRVGTPSGQR